MKNKNYHTVGPVPKSNKNIVERVKVDSLTDIYMAAHFTFFIQLLQYKVVVFVGFVLLNL